jgi:hypothetical protein
VSARSAEQHRQLVGVLLKAVGAAMEQPDALEAVDAAPLTLCAASRVNCSVDICRVGFGHRAEDLFGGGVLDLDRNAGASPRDG